MMRCAKEPRRWRQIAVWAVAVSWLAAEGTVHAEELAEASTDAESAGAPYAYTAEGLRDPMKSLLPERRSAVVASTKTTKPAVVSAPVPPRTGMLQGILWGGTMPQAIIDGQVYAVGDMIGGAKIVAIDQRGVMMETADAAFLLSAASRAPSMVRQLARHTDEEAPEPQAQSTGSQGGSVKPSEARGGSE